VGASGIDEERSDTNSCSSLRWLDARLRKALDLFMSIDPKREGFVSDVEWHGCIVRWLGMECRPRDVHFLESSI
jgi:hypothetical protein